MAGLALNKTTLKQQRDRLQMFQRFLPSLELKRQQLLVELQKARSSLEARRRDVEQIYDDPRGLLSLLGSSELNLSGLVQVRGARIDRENVLGVELPVLGRWELAVREYSTLARPHWVDTLAEVWAELVTAQMNLAVEEERVRRLDQAVKRITQRVNLFEKVLIPRARKHIQRILVYLSDAECAAVVRSKIAKAKRIQATEFGS